MLTIKAFEVNPLQENCYVVSDDTKECVIIDCGALYDNEQRAIQNYIREQQLKPVHHLCTHGHFDHITSLPEIVRRNPKTLIHCTKEPYRTLVRKGVDRKNLHLLHYGDTLKVNGFQLSVLHGRHAILPKATLKRLVYILKHPAKGNIPFILRENRVAVENDETVFYKIEANEKTICLMGSMNLRDEVEYPVEADLLILPYNGWEDNFPPAVRVIERLKPKRVLLDHYDDTFPPLTMPLDLEPILGKYEGRVMAMRIGEVEEV